MSSHRVSAYCKTSNMEKIFTTLETGRELEPECVLQYFWDRFWGRQVSESSQLFTIFSPCLATVPEMFVLIDSVQFTFFWFLSGKIGTVWYFPLYASRVLTPIG